MINKGDIQDLVNENHFVFRSTQRKLCIPIINRMYKKMRAGITFRGINVENDLICDGHHRYIASLLADYSIERLPTNRTAATIITCWESVVFEEDEWDTTAEIDKFNQQDADDNNMPIEKVIEILK